MHRQYPRCRVAQWYAAPFTFLIKGPGCQLSVSKTHQTSNNQNLMCSKTKKYHPNVQTLTRLPIFCQTERAADHTSIGSRRELYMSRSVVVRKIEERCIAQGVHDNFRERQTSLLLCSSTYNLQAYRHPVCSVWVICSQSGVCTAVELVDTYMKYAPLHLLRSLLCCR